jgi:tRNA 5-methylaminomethyl-2-thiouridine biosynthesis bifunctional protein
MDITNSADITWDAEGQPSSRLFADIYFSSASGIEESRYVFIQHNDLIQRWQALAEGSSFVIAETGFGSGLNFLVAWQTWLNSAPVDATLHFISVEKYPLLKADLIQALSLWTDLQPLTQQLVAQYPSVDARGFHRLHFGQVQLTLIFDDAVAGLRELSAIENPGERVRRLDCGWTPFTDNRSAIDAWFLDGFSPTKNPQMWSPELFAMMATLSGPTTTFATFTAAGLVRRGLQEVGFAVRKTPGFGPKRDMICGQFIGADNHPPALRRPSPSWHLCLRQQPAPKDIAIVGAGLAGCHTAYALAEQGFQVTLIDRSDIAAGASGNPQGVVYSKLSPVPGILGEFNVAALCFALRFYHRLGLFAECGEACGVLQVAEDEETWRQQQSLAEVFRKSPELVQCLDRDAASLVAGIELNQGGLWLPLAGWLDPAQLCRILVQHPNIHVIRQTEVHALERSKARWRLFDQLGNGLCDADAVVIACAHTAKNFPQFAHLPTKSIRGQISLAADTDQTRPLRTILCGQGYVAPSRRGQHVLGASFNLTEQSLVNRWEEHQENLRQIHPLAPALAGLNISQLDHGRASLRCTTPDYLPLVGPAPDLERMTERFGIYRKNARATVDAPGEYWPGLFLNIGHGSKGLTYTPLCAQLLASMISNQPLPLSRNLTQHIHSARFLLRDLARNRL